ncbi:endonuclease/exonuclease/phosphatase family protein [Chitinophagaceae bacterium MMS25-I14]
MKKIFYASLLFISLHSSAQNRLNVMTFNLRYNNPGDSLNSWPYRKDNVASEILFHDVNLLGVQEGLSDQVADLDERLPQFKHFGVGRDDGKTKGEYSAIFYDTTRLQWQDGATFWLSQTPETPGSRGWDAVCNRIVTWCRFKDKKSGKIFFAFNTHFDHMGKVARAESAKLLLKRVKDIAGKNPVIVTGDFNAIPSDEPIQMIADVNNPEHLTDSKKLSKTPHYGPSGTFNAFHTKETSDEPIDHIFIKNKVSVYRHATISESWQGRFSSDHFPVFATVEIK